MKNRRMALMALVMVSSVAFAGPRGTGSPPPPFVPEIGYTYSSGRNSSELRLSNREGTAAILVHRSNIAQGIPKYDLAPPNVDRRPNIAFIEKDGTGRMLIKLTTWYRDADGNVRVSTPTTLLTTSSATYQEVMDVEFSPDGTKLAYMIAPASLEREIYIYDLLLDKTELLIKTNSGFSLAWHASGNHLYYDTFPDENSGLKFVFRVPTNQGVQSAGQLFISRTGIIGDLEVTRPYSTYYIDGLIVSYSEGGANRVAFYKDDGVASPEPQVFLSRDGSPLPARNAQINCTGSTMLHQMMNTRNLDRGMYNTVTRDVTTWSTDKAIGILGWMPCA